MCGIAGYVTRGAEPPKRGVLTEMTDALTHRGPDGWGLHSEKHPSSEMHVGLGHRRLAVIDVDGGRQPMSTDRGRLWIVYNGEVYNFEEIRKELEGEGVRFRTRSDTEVVLELYRSRGIDMLSSLRGMFAFAIWDRRQRTLFLARDRLGQKPLVYFHDRRRFAFASEIKALHRLPWVPREPALEMLPAYLLHQYVPSPRSFFRGIRKLPPAHYLVLRDGKVQVRRYWDVAFTGDSREPRWVQARRLEEAVDEATRLRLVSDVPLGSFLSGGIDSSVIASCMARSSGSGVKTFSIGFDRSSFDETGYARLVSRRLSTEHQESRVTPQAMAILPKLVWHFDEPFGDSSAIPTYYLARMTRQHVTVALSGDGGDEILGGYDRYRAVLAAEAADRLLGGNSRRISSWAGSPGLGRRASRWLEAMALPPEERYLQWVGVFTPEQIHRVLEPWVLEEAEGKASSFIQARLDAAAGNDGAHRAMEADLKSYLPEDILVKVDITTMANSLECRSPFLDHRLVELAARIPRPWKVGPFRSKGILREAFAGRLPRRVLRRGKMGFGVPVGEWFRGDHGDALAEILTGRTARSRGIFRMAEVERMISEHRSGVASHGHRLWSLLFFEMWMRGLGTAVTARE